MAYKSHIKTSGVRGGAGGGKGSSKSAASVNTYGRVVHVVLSLDDPYCLSPSMINGVYYRTPKVAADETDISKFPFAYQGSAQNRTIPLPGEMVTLYTGADTNSLANPGATKPYWKEVVNLWNHPHHNAAPDTLQSSWEENLLKGFPTQKDINPLVANPGDTLIEGRLGQSIRFGGSKGASTIINDNNNGKPIIIISNGQVKTDNGSDLIEENINEDFNSFYFTSDHQIPLTSANTKRDSYNEVPKTSDQFKGNQVILNGGRLYFNAKEESAFISAKESIGLNANTLNLDATDYFCVDAKKIYLGKKARTASSSVQQPVVLGKQLENWMGALLDALDSVATAMGTASAVGAGPLTQINATGPILKSTVQSLKTQYKLFQSKKVFVE
jgi:hypothetical protein